MKLVEWNQLPSDLQIDIIKEYYDIIYNKRKILRIKRLFDIILSFILLIILFPVFLVISIFIKIDSKGPVLFKQTRVTQYGRRFEIYKFRTMVKDADKNGSQVTRNNDVRITNVGSKLRGLRLDELPQLINVFLGDMSFVGTRPEVPKYVSEYTNEMKATLLLPAGITSLASIKYKDEAKLLSDSNNINKTYIDIILPEKMKYNLEAIKEFSFWSDIKIMMNTIIAVLN